jgi:RecA-family ATPase
MLRWADGQRLLLIDTLRRFHGSDENDSSAASELMSVLEHVASATGTTIVYLHHSSKYSVWNGRTDEAAASRGSSVFTDHPRWMAALVGMTQKEAEKYRVQSTERWRFLRLTHPKCNYAQVPPETWLHRTSGGVLVRANLTDRTPLRGYSRRQTCDE